MADRDDGFLRRWSTRKAQVESEAKTKDSEADPAVAAVDADAHPLPASDPEAGADEPEAVAVEDLPDIESLDRDSDFTVFLKEGVPEKLRNMALRKLWLSDPVLANVDGLVEYGEDFTDAALVVEGMQSAYQVGKGFITEEDEKKMAEQAAKDAAEAEQAESAEAEQAAEGAEPENADAETAGPDADAPDAQDQAEADAAEQSGEADAEAIDDSAAAETSDHDLETGSGGRESGRS